MKNVRRPLLRMALLGCLGLGIATPSDAALSPPTTLTTTPINASKYQISWTPPSGATSSTVILTKDNGTMFRIRTSGNSITPVFPSSGAWSLSITSRNAIQESSPLNAAVIIAIPAPTQAPTGVIVQNFDARANLRWNSIGDGYTMRLSWTDPATNQAQLLITNGTFAALRGLVNGVTYSIQMAWQNETGQGPSTTVVLQPVGNRIASTVTPTTTGIGPTSTFLSWSSTPGATFYAVYAGSVNDFLTQRHSALPRIVTTPSILLTGVTNQDYAFVLAGNMNGLGPAPSTGTQLSVISTVTQAPTLSLNPGPLNLTASWTSVPGATTYSIFYMATPFIQGAATRVDNVTNPYVINSLINGQPYGVAVLGANSAGDGPLSEVQIGSPATAYIGYQAIGVDLTTGPAFRGAGIELDNGLVFYPGSSKNSEQINAAYLFNPATEVWTSAAPFPSGPYYDVNGGDPHRMVKLNDGRILAISNPRRERPAIYNPSTNSWTQTGPLMPPMVSGADLDNYFITIPGYDFALAVLPDGRVLLAGGRLKHRTDTAPIQKAWLYSPATNLWTETAPILGEGRYGHALVKLFNGKILLVGGTSGVDYGAPYYGIDPTCRNPYPDRSCYYAMPSSQLFDPTTETWSASGEMVNKRYYHTVSLLQNGDVLAFGGFISGNNNPDGMGSYTTERYSPTTGTWASVGSMPTVQTNANQDYNFIAIRYRGPVVKTLPDGHVVWISDKAPFHEDAGAPDELTFVMFDPNTNQWMQSTAASAYSPYQCGYFEIFPGFGFCGLSEDHGSVVTILNDGKVIVTGGPNVPRLYN